jgi:NAD(P)-dependent dehydrogenase (short-subunit alcohol dehydrogenase family)
VDRLTGKVAIVTGGASGIGLAIAERLRSEGADVVVGDRDGDALAALDFVGVECDVTDEAGPAALVAAAVDRFGRLDIAVANAGGGVGGPILDMPVATWRDIVDLNLTGAFLTLQAAGRVLDDGGAMVALSSLNGVQPGNATGAYAAAKAGVIALVDVTALELGPRGIRVNAVAPGLVRTPATAVIWQVPGLLEGYVDNTFLGRHGEPADIAAAVAYLVSDDARYVTGTTLLVDGGAHHLSYPNLRKIAGAP